MSITVPGKIFIAGEYSVLQGGRGLFAAVRPGYTFAFGEGKAAHPDSPLGKYAAESGKELFFEMGREVLGAEKKYSTESGGLAIGSTLPGFGSSTAELIAGVFHDLGRLPETKRLWAWYREQFPRASGGDLCVQMEALRRKRALFEFERGQASSLVEATTHPSAQIYVFQTPFGRKVKTHEALEQALPDFNIPLLNTYVNEIKTGFETGNSQHFSRMNDYADEMHRLGIETDFAQDVRRAFCKQRGVFAVKGCGAGLNDVFLVVLEGTNANETELTNLQSVAREFQLTCLGSLAALLW